MLTYRKFMLPGSLLAFGLMFVTYGAIGPVAMPTLDKLIAVTSAWVALGLFLGVIGISVLLIQVNQHVDSGALVEAQRAQQKAENNERSANDRVRAADTQVSAYKQLTMLQGKKLEELGFKPMPVLDGDAFGKFQQVAHRLPGADRSHDGDEG